mgnify:CR=1 FL=1
MKLRNHQFSTRPQIFDGGYEHPWYKHLDKELKSPKPPTQEAVEKAKFVDKTYHWNGGVRPRNKRTPK